MELIEEQNSSCCRARTELDRSCLFKGFFAANFLDFQLAKASLNGLLEELKKKRRGEERRRAEISKEKKKKN